MKNLDMIKSLDKSEIGMLLFALQNATISAFSNFDMPNAHKIMKWLDDESDSFDDLLENMKQNIGRPAIG